MNIFLYIFFITLFLIINSYFIFPFVIKFFSLFKRNYKTQEYKPTISIIISAYNEEKVIEERVKNISEQNYDFNKIEILIGSDNSSDNTNNILLDMKKKYLQLKVFLFDERRGKFQIVKDLIDKANNDIILFTDANTIFNANSIKNLVRHFTNNKIGGVCGRLILTDDELKEFTGVEEKKYWMYETFIKKAEGKLGILIGANGGIFAIRKSILVNLTNNNYVTDDLYFSLLTLSRGYKFIYEKDAIGIESVGKNLKSEFNRKVRFMATNLETLFHFKKLIFNKNLLLSYAFWSHKILRWFVSFFLILIFFSNIFIIFFSKIYLYFFILQFIFLFLALCGFIFSKFGKRFFLFSFPFFFLYSNFALLIGVFKFLFKKHSNIWTPTDR